MFGKNWKTNLAGVIFIASGVLATLGNGKVKEVSQIVFTAAGGTGLLVAKDAKTTPN